MAGTLGQADWTGVMKLITHLHAHTHTHTAAAIRSRAAGFITAVYFLLLYEGNVIPLLLLLHISLHHGEGDGDGAEGVDGCPLSLLPLLSGERESPPTKWPRSPNMAPTAGSGQCTSEDGHEVFNIHSLLVCLEFSK